jgi:hypothetical protein
VTSIDTDWPADEPAPGRVDIVVAVRSAEGSVGTVLIGSAKIDRLDRKEQLDRIVLNLLEQMP